MAQALERRSIEHINDILPYLHYKEDELYIYGTKASDIIEELGTPSIMYMPERARDNARTFMQAFKSRFENFRPFYALKSCYIPDIVTAIRKEGFFIEVMSDYEMKIAQLCGFNPNEMSLNGVGRSEEYQNASVDPQIHINYLDSIDDIQFLSAKAQKKGIILNVGLRINPANVDDSLYIRESNKLGLDWEGGHFVEALKVLRDSPNLKLRAILCHQFYHLTDLKKFEILLRQYVDLIDLIYRDHGHQFDIIDIGGGYETRFLMEQAGVSIEDFAEVCANVLRNVPYEFSLQAQPGRYLTADTAIGFTKINAVKIMSKSNWAITDLGSNVLVPIPGLVYHPVPLSIKSGDEWVEYNLGDGTCAPSAVCRESNLPSVSKYSQLVLLNCGGYTTVFSQIWAFNLPQIYIFGKKMRLAFSSANFKQMVKAFYGYEL